MFYYQYYYNYLDEDKIITKISRLYSSENEAMENLLIYLFDEEKLFESVCVSASEYNILKEIPDFDNRISKIKDRDEFIKHFSKDLLKIHHKLDLVEYANIYVDFYNYGIKTIELN